MTLNRLLMLGFGLTFLFGGCKPKNQATEPAPTAQDQMQTIPSTSPEPGSEKGDQEEVPLDEGQH